MAAACRGLSGVNHSSQQYAAPIHNQRDVDLLAVRLVIAQVASLGLRVARRLALKPDAGHFVQQQVDVELN